MSVILVHSSYYPLWLPKHTHSGRIWQQRSQQTSSPRLVRTRPTRVDTWVVVPSTTTSVTCYICSNCSLPWLLITSFTGWFEQLARASTRGHRVVCRFCSRQGMACVMNQVCKQQTGVLYVRRQGDRATEHVTLLAHAAAKTVNLEEQTKKNSKLASVFNNTPWDAPIDI